MNCNTTTSFHLNGFWFHLSHVENTTYKDQQGMTWFKNGNQFISEGGGFVYETPKPSLKMDNKEFLHYSREASRFEYQTRIANL